MNDVCYLCGSHENKIIHRGVRGNKKIDVLKCIKCGLVRLSEFPKNIDEFYEESNMRKDESMDYRWIRNEAEMDDARRFMMTKSTITNKKILDFGCGAGGYLELAQRVAYKAFGVEPENAMRNQIRGGILCFPSIRDIGVALKNKIDVITLWHVLEHLEDPADILNQLGKFLCDSGKIIIEVPNADDALISLYQCQEFQDFTYWETHLYLFTSETLQKVVEIAGLRVKFLTQIQRYPISNHLYWLTRGKPGGHCEWSMLDDYSLNESYGKKLISLGVADTILAEVTR